MTTPQNPTAARRSAHAVFFLSHARTPVFDPRSDHDPDYWVRRFYDDLLQAVMAALPLEQNRQPAGFMDMALPISHDWATEISEALAACRVFVPLYSPRYFVSESCGREWTAIENRLARDRGLRRPPSVRILPVLWGPVNAESIPEVGRRNPPTVDLHSDAYPQFGLSGLIRLARWRTDYQDVVDWLARQVAEAAAATAPPAELPVNHLLLPNAFEDAAEKSPIPRLRITVMAPTTDSLPAGRDSDYYGPQIVDWQPFVPLTSRTLAGICVDVVTSLGFQPVVEDWRSSRVLSSEDSPGLLLVDPWAAEVDGSRAESGAEARGWLKDFDSLKTESTGIVIATNPADRQSAEASARLETALRRCLPRRLAVHDPRDRSLARISSLEKLGRVLPTVTSAAAKQFLRRAKAYPPTRDPIAKPRLTRTGMPNPSQAGDHSQKEAADE